jgi:DNA modification methylase
VHLVVTSPPYFNLKEYNRHPGQLGAMDDYEAFHDALDEVWRHCYRVLVVESYAYPVPSAARCIQPDRPSI